MVRKPTTITVHAQDWHTNKDVDGRVIIDNQQVGITNTPFTYTFNTTSHSVYGQIIAHGYPDTKILFSLAFPNPQVRAEPNKIPINTPVTVTIFPSDPFMNGILLVTY